MSEFQSANMIAKPTNFETVWQPNPNIVKSDYPGVNWNDIGAVSRDQRLGHWVLVPVAGLTTDQFSAAAADGIVTEEEWNNPKTLAIGAGLGLLALLAL